MQKKNLPTEILKLIDNYQQGLILEKNLSQNSVIAYRSDIELFFVWYLSTIDSKKVNLIPTHSIPANLIYNHIHALNKKPSIPHITAPEKEFSNGEMVRRLEALSSLQIDKKTLAVYSGWLKNVRKISDRSRSRAMSALKNFWEYCIDNIHEKDDCVFLNINKNLPRLMPTAKYVKTLPSYLEEQEIDSLLNLALQQREKVQKKNPKNLLSLSFVAHRNYVLILTLYMLGLRISEALRLSIKDFFVFPDKWKVERGLQKEKKEEKKITGMQTNTFQLEKNANPQAILSKKNTSSQNIANFKGVYFQNKDIKILGKGDKRRLQPIDTKLSKIIGEYVFGSLLETIYPKNLSPDTPVFCNQYGERLSRVGAWKSIKDIAKKAGIIKKISPHTFRHSYATHLLRNGANLKTVQALLGHSKITTTETYTHVVNKDLQKAFEKFHPLYH